MKNTILAASVLLAVLCGGCAKQETLTPTTDPEPVFRLPQGNNDYDTRIMGLYEKYNFMTLYKFNPKDIYWQIGGTTAGYVGPNDYFGHSLVAEQADPEYIDRMIDFVEDNMLAYYPDTLLRRCMPLRLYLCSVLDKTNLSTGAVTGKNNIYYSKVTGYIALNYVNADFASLTDAQKKTFVDELNNAFMEWTYDGGLIPAKDEFFLVSDYVTSVTSTTMFSRGFLTAAGKTSIVTDWKTYVKTIITNSYTELTTQGTGTTLKGILHPSKDTNGLIRQKYDIVVNYFLDNYNLDLQAIGNATVI